MELWEVGGEEIIFKEKEDLDSDDDHLPAYDMSDDAPASKPPHFRDLKCPKTAHSARGWGVLVFL